VSPLARNAKTRDRHGAGRETLESDVTSIANEIATRSRFGLTLTKQAMNFIENMRGKRTSMEALFPMRHLAHAHIQLTTGSLLGGLGAKEMAAANMKAASKS
jgi:enoyl-CoA hydratase